MSIKCIFLQQKIKKSSPMKLSSITIATPPTKTTYNEGEQFDPTGMVVEATYSINDVPVAEHVPVAGYQWSPTTLTRDTTEVKIIYSEGGISAEANIPVTVDYVWEWGSETDTVDDIGTKSWWAGLKKWVLTASADELAACLGKTKYVILSSPVRSVTGHFVRCIGYNLDGNQTLTFQTDTCFKNLQNSDFCTSQELSAFSNQALWTDGTTDSQARRQCKDYYNYFPGKDSIKTVQKRYLSTQPNSLHTKVCNKVYDETVFLPSENEMGWKSTGQADTSLGCGGASNEVCPENIDIEPYQYYTDNNKRIKKAQGVGSYTGKNFYYMLRSRYYGQVGYMLICIVSATGAPDSASDGGLAPAFVIG